MARLKKPRRCCGDLKGRAFKPTGVPLAGLERVAIFRDEIEAIRLCDLEGLSQHEAGQRMGVSRGTVQRILSSARRKTAEALSGCKALVLEEVLCGPPAKAHTKQGGMKR